MTVYLLGTGDGGIILGDGSGYLLLGDSPAEMTQSSIMSNREYLQEERPEEDKYSFRIRHDW